MCTIEGVCLISVQKLGISHIYTRKCPVDIGISDRSFSGEGAFGDLI